MVTRTNTRALSLSAYGSRTQPMGWTWSARVAAWVFMCISICATYLLLALFFGNQGSPLSGWFVTDGITLLNSAHDDAFTSAAEILFTDRANAGLAVLNNWLVQSHRLLPALFNVALILFIFGSRIRYGAVWPVALLIGAPYYIACFPLPSKDILVAALFVVIADRFAEQGFRLFLPTAIATAMFFVRDGYALILLASLLAIATAEKARIHPIVLLVVVTVGSSAFWLIFEGVFEDWFLYARATGIAEQSDFAEITSSVGPYSFFFRLMGNATNLAFRPVFLDVEGNLHVVSLFYWVSGVTLLCSFALCARALVSPLGSDRRMGLIGLLSLVLVSITPYVQPRYLLPVCLLLPMFSFTSAAIIARLHVAVALVSLIASAAYAYIGNYPPLAEPPPFVLSLD
jgi:hypothetical protein